MNLPAPAPIIPSRTRPTQKDIARELGVSQATVAMALNPRSQSKLMAETVAQVQAKAKEMNYSPQRQASILRSGRSYTIGVIFMSSIYHAPQQRVTCLARAAVLAGYQLVAVDVEWFDRDVEQAAEYLRGAAAEGVVLCNLAPDLLRQWSQVIHDWPVVFMGAELPGGVNACSDMEDAFYRMTLHHLEQKSRRLTLLLSFYDAPVMDLNEAPVIQSRVSGFKRAILEVGGAVFTDCVESGKMLGLPLVPAGKLPECFGQVVYSERSGHFESAFELGAWYVQSLVDKGEPLPDSLVCNNDQIAAGALRTCLQERIAVPDTLRVSGADDAPFSRFCGIPISTVAQPSKDIADFCIRRIAKMIEQPEERNKPQKKLFPCELIYRNSTIGPGLGKPVRRVGKKQP